MSFDPYAPYGAVIETTCRVVTWNVWGRYGEWSTRLRALIEELHRFTPDIVCLEEAWTTPRENQADMVGEALGLSHRFSCGDWQQDGWTSGAAICSRWPITTHQQRSLPGDADAAGSAVYARIDGPRGPDRSVRRDAGLPTARQRRAPTTSPGAGRVRSRTASPRHPIVICGDFNAGPDSDELRMLTGRSEPAVAGMVEPESAGRRCPSP